MTPTGSHPFSGAMSTAHRHVKRRHSPTKLASKAPALPDKPPHSILPIALSVLAGAVYTATAARDVVVGDSGEFLAAAARLGVAHPPGYPILVLLGHAFSWLPIGPLPFRINMLAVVLSASTVGLVCATALRLGTSRTAGVVASLALALNPLIWEWSLAIEAFPLNNLISAALVYCLVRWDARPEASRFLVAAALLGGLGAANHLTIVFLVPFVAVVIWRRRSILRAPTLLACVGAVLVGLLPYLYIPWAAARDPFLNWGNISSASGLLRHFLRADYGTGRLVSAGAAGEPLERLAGFAASFSVLESVMIVIGFAQAWRSVRWYFWGCLLSVLLAGPAFAAYANIDVSKLPALWVLRRFFLLPHVVLAPLAALGYAGMMAGIEARLKGQRLRQARVVLASVVVAVIAIPAALRYSKINQADNHVARLYAEDLLASTPPRSVLLTLGDEVGFPLAYVQAAENQRPDVTLVILGLFKGLKWYIAQLRRRDPGLIIPFNRYDPQNPASTLRALVEANPGRTFELVGTPLDSSLNGSFWLYRRGLVDEIEPLDRDIGLYEAAAENSRLMALYHVPNALRIRRNTFEVSILTKYAAGPTVMGDHFASKHLDAQAADWYRRALAIDPEETYVQGELYKLSNKARQ